MGCCMAWKFDNQGHAEDRLLFYRYCYYVVGKPVVGDLDYDTLEEYIKTRWSISIVTHTVGSSNAADYPAYIRGRYRPDKAEREIRDKAIVERWLKHL